MTVKPWSGRDVMRARALVARYLPAPCGRCGQVVKPDDSWVVGHKLDRATHPHLTWVESNWQPEHRVCSDRTGQAAVIAKARQEGARAALQQHLFDASDLAVFPAETPPGQPPPLPVSLPATGEPIETRPDLVWSPDALLEHSWTAPFADVPGDAAPPLHMTPVPDDAVGSYAVEACDCCGLTALEWIEQMERKRLRWWQRLAIVRQLEHRDDGSLCHSEILESCPRRAGKSVRVRGVAMWRMRHGERLFGEVQTVIHTGSDVAICREIQRGAWRWCKDNGWGVVIANGKEAVERLEGDRWMVKAQDAVYGYDVTLGIGDECWNVKPDTVTEGLEPAMLERSSPQLHLTSTAHRRATSLMRTKIVTELTGVDLEPGTLLLIWAAPHGSDPADPAVWRAASPHWSEDRRKLITKKYSKALAGEVDPAADDPDPMAGFVAQYLNVWPMRAPDAARGNPLTNEAHWTALADDRPTGRPAAAAIESWFDAGVSLALAWHVGGRVVVSVTDHDSVAAAVNLARAAQPVRPLLVGKTLLTDPAFAQVQPRPQGRTGRAGAAVGELMRLIREDLLRHDGGDHLAGQAVAARTVAATEGPRVVSTGRADALKAAAWAAEAARLPGIGKPRIITSRKRASAR